MRRAAGTEDVQESDGPEDMDQEQGELVHVPEPQQTETGRTSPGPSANIKTEEQNTASKQERTSHGETQPGQQANPTKLPPRTTLQEDEHYVVSGRPKTSWAPQMSGDTSDQVSKGRALVNSNRAYLR